MLKLTQDAIEAVADAADWSWQPKIGEATEALVNAALDAMPTWIIEQYVDARRDEDFDGEEE